MRIGYFLALSLLPLCLPSCVDKAYDMQALLKVNTEMNFGGDHFSVPIGSFQPILLGRFIKAGDLLRVSEGKYEFAFQDNQTSTLPVISPINFDVNAVPVAGIPVDLSGVSINDIDLPDIKIDQTASATVVSGATSATVLMNNLTSPISILYQYTDEIQQVNHILFGATAQGQQLVVALTPNYGTALTAASTQINNFSITFPYGFVLQADPSDPYQGTISPDGKSYTVTTQTVQQGKGMSFYVHKITFDPSIDQTTQGTLRYNQDLTYSGSFTLTGTATGAGGTVGVALYENKKLVLQNGNFNTNTFTAQVPVQNTPVGVDEAINDPAIQNVRKVILAQRTPIQIELDVTGLPAQATGMTLKDYKVNFPTFMIFEDPIINATKTMVLNDAIPNGGKLNKTIYLTGFEFQTNPINNGRLVVSGQVTSSGGISLNPITNLLSSEIDNVVIKPSVTLGTMQAGKIEAVIKPDVSISPIEIKVDLASDMEFLRQSVLDLDRVALQVRVENSTKVAAQIGVQLIPYDTNNSPLTDNIVEQKTGMVIQPSTTSELWLSNSTTGMPEGYTFVENTKINSLFRTVPLRVEALLEVLANQVSSTIDFNEIQPTQLTIDYALVAPIALGKGFKLVYKERVTGLHNQLAELLKYTRSLELTMVAQNNIPLDLSVSATALDASGNAIPVSIEAPGVLAGGTKQGGYKESTVVLSFKENEPNALNRLDQIDLFLIGVAPAGETGAELQENQVLKLKMSAQIPGGLNIKVTQ